MPSNHTVAGVEGEDEMVARHYTFNWISINLFQIETRYNSQVDSNI
jgi:hypothetical protein